MDDLISRQAAIDAINRIQSIISHNNKKIIFRVEAADVIKSLPSAQPERLTDDDFETIRIHLSAIKGNLCNQHRWEEAEEYQRIIDRFMSFATAQLEIVRCEDCKWWTKQEASLQGRCALFGIYPTGKWYCANADMRGENE